MDSIVEYALNKISGNEKQNTGKRIYDPLRAPGNRPHPKYRAAYYSSRAYAFSGIVVVHPFGMKGYNPYIPSKYLYENIGFTNDYLQMRSQSKE